VSTVHLGFEVGTGKPVEIPLAHTFVTGQTQLSGKTTTLRALVERSQQCAIAFVTKRGEAFEGRRIRPYLPREGDRQLHWRLVETLMAAALGQRNMKWERGAIVTATKGATTLADVRRNIARLRDKTKKPQTEELYMLLGEYLDLVLPELEALQASSTLELAPGLNVMDLADVAAQTQAWVIRAALEHINRHEHGVLTVFPEAWEFAPRGRGGPAKDEAIAMARKGAVLGNFLLCDSQDLAGVDTVVRQAASVWILGVQRELNELKRTVQMIPAGIARPKPEQIATLELGQFYACWGKHSVKTYVQPSWMPNDVAREVAAGHTSVQYAHRFYVKPTPAKTLPPVVNKEHSVTHEEAARLTRENEQLKADNAELRRRLEALEKGHHDVSNRDRAPDRAGDASGRAGARDRDGAAASHAADAGDLRGRGGARTEGERAAASPPRTFTAEETFNNEALYQAIKARLIGEAANDPILLKVLKYRPELEVTVQRRVVTADGGSLKGRVARLVAAGFFREGATQSRTRSELARTGPDVNNGNLYRTLQELVTFGFLTDEGATGYREVPGAKVNIIEQ